MFVLKLSGIQNTLQSKNWCENEMFVLKLSVIQRIYVPENGVDTKYKYEKMCGFLGV